MNGNQLMRLTLDKSVVTKDMVITCTVDIHNTSVADVYKDFILSYTLPKQLMPIPNTVLINGQLVEGIDIVTGIYIQEVISNKPIQVQFGLKVINDLAVNLMISIQGDFFIYTEDTGWIRNKAYTNDEEVAIVKVKLDCQQTVMRAHQNEGERITYNIVLSNIGDIAVYQILFKDTLPENSEFLQGSFELNGHRINGVDLSKGIYIGELESNAMKTIAYQVQNYGSKWVRDVSNDPTVSYVYQIGSHSLENRTENFSAKEELVGQNVEPVIHYKQVERTIKLEEDNLEVQGINQSIGTVEILSYEEIETPIRSKETGDIERAYKLVIRGVVNVMIDYTTVDPENSTDTIQISLPFTTFILLPSDHDLNARINFKAQVLKSNVIVVDSKTLLISTLNKMQIKVIKLA